MRTLPFLVVLLVAHVGGCTAGTAVTPAATPPPSVIVDGSAQPSTMATPITTDREAVASDRGLFVGSWSSEAGTPPINTLHEWVLYIETADGVPVEGAIVTVDGDMPAHGHGMPTVPQVTADLGGGNYRVEGMEFQMGGHWVVDITVTAGGQSDRIRFDLEL